MKKTMTMVGAALAFGSGASFAGGIERAPQSLGILFEQGNYAELSFGGVSPSLSGRDTLGFDTGNVASGYGFFGLAYKHQFTPNLSGAFIVEQPFGADLRYESAANGGSVMLGGTAVSVDSTTYTALLRYKFENNFSVHGGIRGSRASGNVTLNGCAYSSPLAPVPCTGGVMGYNVDTDTSWGVGWVAGVAYEIPDLAARVSLTYNSPIEHDFGTKETISGMPLGPDTETKVKTPRSWTLEGQTGIAEDTLLFGSIRWVNWSEFRVDPPIFYGLVNSGLVELEDSTTYTIGVGRRFTDAWSGSASFTYEPSGKDLVSPLAPTNGRKSMTLAAIYTMDNIKITTGINYTKLGNAKPETGTPDVQRADMRGNDLWGMGVKIGYAF